MLKKLFLRYVNIFYQRVYSVQKLILIFFRQNATVLMVFKLLSLIFFAPSSSQELKLKHPKIKLHDIQTSGALSSLKLMLRASNNLIDIDLHHFFFSLPACILRLATNSFKGRCERWCEFYFIYSHKHHCSLGNILKAQVFLN